MKKALIAMSGGVDSSVAALRMREAGWTCIGVHLRLFDGPGPESGCCSLESAEDARSVAYRLGMPFYVFNFTREFTESVIAPFAAAYRRGETPNPCLACNRHIKFGALLRRARELGCDALVTGHYARILCREDGRHLLRAVDETKDQSYALCTLTQEQLAFLRFPLGELTKTQVRALAAGAGLVTARKPDSQDLCFAPDGDCAAAVRRYDGRESVPGDFLDREDRVLGRHRGVEHYTVGQRRGLGLALGERMYVLDIRREDNAVVLGPEEALPVREITVPVFHWIVPPAPSAPFHAEVCLRYRQRPRSAEVIPLPGGGVRLVFDEPVRRGAPGQTAAVYRNGEVLGGGVMIRGAPPPERTDSPLAKPP